MFISKHVCVGSTFIFCISFLTSCENPDKFIGKWSWDGHKKSSTMYINKSTGGFSIANSPNGEGFPAVYDSNNDKLVMHYCCGGGDILFDRKIDVVYVPKVDNLIVFDDSIPSVYSRLP